MIKEYNKLEYDYQLKNIIDTVDEFSVLNEELLKLGFNIDKKKIIIKNPINTLGYHIVKINLHKKVTLDLKVEIVEK